MASEPEGALPHPQVILCPKSPATPRPSPGGKMEFQSLLGGIFSANSQPQVYVFPSALSLFPLFRFIPLTIPAVVFHQIPRRLLDHHHLSAVRSSILLLETVCGKLAQWPSSPLIQRAERGVRMQRHAAVAVGSTCLVFCSDHTQRGQQEPCLGCSKTGPPPSPPDFCRPWAATSPSPVAWAWGVSHHGFCPVLQALETNILLMKNEKH